VINVQVPSDTPANHIQADGRETTVLAVAVAHLDAQVWIELREAVGPSVLDRSSDIAQRVDHPVDLGVGQPRRARYGRHLGASRLPLGLRGVDPSRTTAGSTLARIASCKRRNAVSASVSRFTVSDAAGRGSGNNRNGATSKTVLTDVGAVPVTVPRDRNGSFETTMVPNTRGAWPVQRTDLEPVRARDVGCTTSAHTWPTSTA
jgi:hypothetical protein